MRLIQRFDDSFTALWDELAPKFDARGSARRRLSELEVRRARRTCATRSRRCGATIATSATPSTATLHEPRGRVTLLVDFLADPDDESGLAARCCAGSIARRGRPTRTRSAPSRCTPRFRRVLKRSGYFQVKSTMEFVVKVNGVDVDPSFYERTDRWHVTLGDSDQDR